MHGTDAELDLAFGGNRIELGQVLVRPGMRADGVPALGHFAHQRRLSKGAEADHEECRSRAVRLQRLEHGSRVDGVRTVIERKDDLAFAQDMAVGILVVAESRALHGIHIQGPADAKRVGASLARRWRLRLRACPNSSRDQQAREPREKCRAHPSPRPSAGARPRMSVPANAPGLVLEERGY